MQLSLGRARGAAGWRRAAPLLYGRNRWFGRQDALHTFEGYGLARDDEKRSFQMIISYTVLHWYRARVWIKWISAPASLGVKCPARS